MNKNILTVVSGPSGVGKGTVVARAVEIAHARGEDVELSVSMTTRDIREGEIPGKSYHFVTLEQFQEALDYNRLLEYNCYGGNYYGTPIDNIDIAFARGRDIILEIDVNGAEQVQKNALIPVTTVFILPPSLEELEHRLRNRGTESEEQIQARLNEAMRELDRAGDFDYNIVNIDIDETAKRLLDIMKAHHSAGTAAASVKSAKMAYTANGVSRRQRKEEPPMKSIDEVFAMADSRYSLVNIVAKKAREITDDYNKRKEELLVKPVNIVLDNLKSGKSTIAHLGAAASIYKDDDFEVNMAVPEDDGEQ